MSVDPKADLYTGWSPYNFVLNNPFKFIDPDGRGPDPFSYVYEGMVMQPLRSLYNQTWDAYLTYTPKALEYISIGSGYLAYVPIFAVPAGVISLTSGLSAAGMKINNPKYSNRDAEGDILSSALSLTKGGIILGQLADIVVENYNISNKKTIKMLIVTLHFKVIVHNFYLNQSIEINGAHQNLQKRYGKKCMVTRKLKTIVIKNLNIKFVKYSNK